MEKGSGIDESILHRSWRDTKHIWTSWLFLILDAIVGAAAGGLTAKWYLGVGIVAFGMLCAWIGATIRAPIKQRNEARILLLAKPKPVPLQNREALIGTIADLKDAAEELIKQKHVLNELGEIKLWNPNVLSKEIEEASTHFQEARKKLRREQLIAGEAFELPLWKLLFYIQIEVDMLDMDIDLGNKETRPTLDELVRETIRNLDKISQPTLLAPT